MRAVLPLLVCLALSPAAGAQEATEATPDTPAPQIHRAVPRLELDFGGRIQSDLRFRVQEKCMGDWYDCRKLPLGVSRNENIAKLKLNASISRFKGVVDVDLVFLGVPEEPECFQSLTLKDEVDPFRIEAHAAYIHARDILFPGLDLRIGQQKVQWGVGDMFNPTNNLNADDLEDPLLFGEQQANMMVKLDYSPHPNWTFSGVLVPVFKPALLPPSGELALAATSRLPFNDPDFRHQIHSQNALSEQLLGYPTRVANVFPEYPDLSARNMQFAFRIAGSIGMQDLAVSYYRGYEDFPVPYLNVGSLDTTDLCEYDAAFPLGRSGDPYENEECVSGFINTDTYLRYPRIQVLGFNWVGEIPVAGLGYRLELGVYFPQHMTMGITNPEIPLFMAEGEYDYDNDGNPGGPQPEVLSDRNFAKWTLGLDYSIGAHVMLNAQWVHGMVDEFGAGDWMYDEGMAVRDGSVDATLPALEGQPDLLACGTEGRGGECAREVLRPKLADYLVFGVDINFARDAALLRLFTIWDLSGYTVEYYDMDATERVSEHYHPFTGEGFSAVLYPEFQYNFGHGFELHVGALIQLGKDYTKFGDPAGGGSQVFVRGRYSF